jgi:hypothetical protein
MIQLEQRESALKCTICGELEGIDPQKMRNEATLAPLRSKMADDHAKCEEYKDNPRRAQIERGYATRMRALIRGIQ